MILYEEVMQAKPAFFYARYIGLGICGPNKCFPVKKKYLSAHGDTSYFKHNNQYIIFLVTKNKDRQRSTLENIYSTAELKQFCKDTFII